MTGMDYGTVNNLLINYMCLFSLFRFFLRIFALENAILCTKMANLSFVKLSKQQQNNENDKISKPIHFLI